MIAKIYENQFSNTVTNIIDNINEFNIDLKINGWSRGELIIPFWDYDLKPYNKIQFYNIENWQDILIFSWYIYNVTLNLDWYKLEIRDENDLMNKKLLLSDKTYTAQTPLQILNDITSDWNTETSEDFSVISNVSDTITIEFNKWDTFYTVLDEISQQLKYNWLVKSQTIFFDEIVNEDKTSWASFQELVYNWIDHSEDNINNLELEYYWNIANLVIWWNSTTKVLKKDTDTRGVIWEYKSFYDGDLNVQAQDYLDLKKQVLFNFKFEITLDKTDINLWDKVSCRIEETPNDLLNFDSDVIINNINLEFKNAKLFKTLSVDTQIVKRNLLSTRLEGIERNVNLLLK